MARNKNVPTAGQGCAHLGDISATTAGCKFCAHVFSQNRNLESVHWFSHQPSAICHAHIAGQPAPSKANAGPQSVTP